MAREINRLSARAVQAKRVPGYYPDGGGLYLQVSTSGTKSWVFRYMLNRKPREMGLGSLLTYSLEEARARRTEQHKLLDEGKDPIEARDAAKARAALDLARSKTFKECAEAYIEAHRTGWKNSKHASQWENTLATYVYPKLGALPVQAIDTGHMRGILEPIWNVKRETASRVRGRVEKILDRAIALSYREGPNPARWRGHLDKILAKDQRRRRVKHHTAMPFDSMAAFLRDLRKQVGTAAQALDFLIHTAARTGEVIGMTWSEVDLEAGVWAVPAVRMKGHHEHRVPLPGAAVRLLRSRRPADCKGDEFVFPGQRASKPLSNMAMLVLLDRMGKAEMTVHGFRSTFRDWAAERTSFPREVAEAALAHAIDSDVEAAYRRGDLFEKRRRLMDAWEKFLSAPSSSVAVTSIRCVA